MTAITYVGVGAVAAGNNATVAPALPAGLAAGDLMVAVATIRNTAATIATPAGWLPVVSGGNVLIVARYYVAADPAPSFVFSGGAAGDTTQGVVAAWRTAVLSVNDGPFAITNASAANVTLPATFTPGRDNGLSLVFAWKQSAWTSVAALAGMTEIVDSPSVLGSGASIALDYRIDTTATALPAGPIVVTGGVSAVSKAYTLSIGQLAFITVTPQATYPPRNLISVTNLVIGDTVEIYRVVSGQRTLVRAGSSAGVTDPSFLRLDAEIPFGIPVSYVAVVEGVEYATSGVTYTLTGGKVAVTDAVTGLAAETVIMAWPSLEYSPQSSTFRAGGRNIVVRGEMGDPSGTIELYVETTSSLENLTSVLESATEGIVQIRQPGGYDGIDSYQAIVGANVRRFSQDGSDQRRLVELEAVEVESWAPALEAAGFTYADLEAAYVGLTYANLAGDYATYLALAQAEF